MTNLYCYQSTTSNYKKQLIVCCRKWNTESAICGSQQIKNWKLTIFWSLIELLSMSAISLNKLKSLECYGLQLKINKLLTNFHLTLQSTASTAGQEKNCTFRVRRRWSWWYWRTFWIGICCKEYQEKAFHFISILEQKFWPTRVHWSWIALCLQSAKYLLLEQKFWPTRVRWSWIALCLQNNCLNRIQNDLLNRSSI